MRGRRYQHDLAEKVKHATRVASAKAAAHARLQYSNFGALADEAIAREAAETTLIEVSAEADRALKTIEEVKAALAQEKRKRMAAETICKEQSGLLKELEEQYTQLVASTKLIGNTASGNGGSSDAEELHAKLQAAREHLGAAMRTADTEQSLRLDAEEAASREAALRMPEERLMAFTDCF